MKTMLGINDLVRPKPEWVDDPNCVPSGRVRATATWGTDGAVYVDGDHRAFATYVFDLDHERGADAHESSVIRESCSVFQKEEGDG